MHSLLGYLRAKLLHYGLVGFREWELVLHAGTVSVLDCLLWMADQDCSDPRDKLYGLASFIGQINPDYITVDYTLSTREVYTNFARTEILSSRDLCILTFSQASSNSHCLPTWVPDWSNFGHPRPLFLRGIREPHFFHYAGKATSPLTSFDKAGDILTVKAVHIGVLGDLSESTGTSSPSIDRGNILSGISKWWILTKSKIACHELIQQAFGRTIGLNRLPLDCEYTDYDYFRGLAGAFARFHKELLAPEYIDPMLQECWDATIKRKKQACQERGTAFDEDGFLEFWWTSADISTFNLWGRRFFISGNVMGLAPDVAMEGDIICVPLGCPHPMIFRQVEDHYVVIGEAYVDDYMHGKAIEMMESGELELKEYELW